MSKLEEFAPAQPKLIAAKQAEETAIAVLSGAAKSILGDVDYHTKQDNALRDATLQYIEEVAKEVFGDEHSELTSKLIDRLAIDDNLSSLAADAFRRIAEPIVDKQHEVATTKLTKHLQSDQKFTQACKKA